MSTRTVGQQRTRQDLLNLLAPLPRVRIAHLPTPLEEAPRLREALGRDAPRILIKREDLTGLALGGNKVRHLEFRLGDIQAKGADTLIVTNVAQSNHARLHTALAAKYGLTTYIIKIPSPRDEPVNGNLLLDHLLGARIVEAPSADPADVALALQKLVAELEADGRVVYSVPTDPFSKIAGTCAYLNAAVELLGQLDDLGARADHIVLASGTSSAGLALAGKALGESYRVHSVSVGGERPEIEAYVCAAANGAAEHLGMSERLSADDFTTYDGYVGERYGVPTEAGLATMRIAARAEALILDPVYTAKSMAALVDQIQRRAFTRDQTVVFVHTGGLPITFAYSAEIMASLERG
ncbi:MAG TPA: D-cysteine desulfhydrase family protein [Thermomicrobiales bacterium]|nr:D-cysteine desulfhydrase family protein [Thermomicrobiales bacterium]